MIPDWAMRLPLNLIYNTASGMRLDAHLIAAICYTESGGKPGRCRYESGYKYIFQTANFASELGTTEDTELLFQKTSWGLMQVMGAVARETGFPGHLPILCQPKEGMYWGCRYFKKLLERFPDGNDAVSAYNQGSPAKDEHGYYKNQLYVDKVMAYYDELTK